MYKKNILITLATVVAVATAYYEQSTETNSGISGMNHHSNQMSGSLSSSDSYSSGNSDMSGMNHQSNQMLGSMSSGNYGSGNSGMSGMSHGSSQIQGSMSTGGYASGSARRNMHQSTGAGSRRSMNIRSSSLSSGSQSNPEIDYQELISLLNEEVISEADNSNTMYIQNQGSAGNNGMLNHGSSGSYNKQNHGISGSFAMQNHGSSGSVGMQNQGSSGSYGMQSHGNSGSVRMQNHGSSGSVGMQNHGSSGSGLTGMNYESVGYY